jgi:putative nucleotidyltransferase with HDIG domain
MTEPFGASTAYPNAIVRSSNSSMLHDIKVLLDNALPLERAGNWQSAIDLCREAFRRSVAERDMSSAIESVLRAGLCYRQTGDRELATEYLDLAVALAQIRGDSRREGRGYNGLATLHHMHGELHAAEELYSRAHELAQRSEDPLTSGHIALNLGTLAAVRGDLTEASYHYDSALCYYRGIAYETGVAGVLNNLGMLHLDHGNFSEAERCFEEALDVCNSIGDVVSEGIVHLNKTELFLARGELVSARSSCDEAFEIVSKLGEHASRADALRFYGIIYREANKPYLAETHLQGAIEVAATHNYPLEEAEAQRELALVLRQQDRNREALHALNRAHELFNTLQARNKQADIDQRVDQLEADFLSLVRSWGESIEAKDRYTSGHCERVADYACRIAEAAGLPEREMVWFRMGAFLHDVGKTEVPGEILNKPGRLTDVERSVIEQHTVIGDEMLSSIEFPWDIRPMIRSHHERWDGKGYPDRLSGSSIPLIARMLRIADVFDALTTTRSYRAPMSPEKAFRIMEEDTGSFDPELFEIFRKLYPEFASGIQPEAISESME